MHEANRTRGEGEEGAVLIIALMVMILLLTLGATLLTVSDDEAVIAANDQWSEGVFYAAEAAVQKAIDSFPEGLATDPPAVPVSSITSGYTYRTGHRTDSSPQAPQLVGTVRRSGYAVGQTSGYQSGGYVFYIYRINGTGLGPKNSVREVEVEIEYGPVTR